MELSIPIPVLTPAVSQSTLCSVPLELHVITVLLIQPTTIKLNLHCCSFDEDLELITRQLLLDDCSVAATLLHSLLTN